MIHHIKKNIIACCTVVAFTISACGGSSAPDTPPTILNVVAQDGTPISYGPDGAYALSADIGVAKSYTISVSEKLLAETITISAQNSEGATTGLPTGMTATLKASDSNHTAYTLTIATTKDFTFSPNTTSKTISLSGSLADSAGNATTFSIKSTINLTAPVVPNNIPSEIKTFNIICTNSSCSFPLVPTNNLWLGCSQETSPNIVCSFDLASFMQPTWQLESISISNPGEANGVGPATASVRSTKFDISIPSGYGVDNFDTVFRFKNAAGESKNFSILIGYLGN